MIVEIHTYRPTAGAGDRLRTALTSRAVPLLVELGIEVVAAGTSLAADPGDADVAYLVRAFADVAARDAADRQLAATPAWVDGPGTELETLSAATISAVLPRAALVGLGYRP